jgi:hypothetical protein
VPCAPHNEPTVTFVNVCTRTRLTGAMLVAVNRYLLDNRRPEAGERFAALAELFDPWTFRHLDDLAGVS